MRVVTLMCLAIAGVFGATGFGAPVLARGQSASPAAATQTAPSPSSAQPAPSAAPQPAAAAAPAASGRNGVPAGLRAAEKRRRSYASCNRESHNRSLRGGARRRFLIRCKLGYERRRQGQPPIQAAPPTQPQPQPPVRTGPPASPPQPQQPPARRP